MPAVGAGGHQPTHQRAAGDGAQGREAHGQAGLLLAKARHQDPKQMGDQADLCHQAQGHGGAQGQELAVAPQGSRGAGGRGGRRGRRGLRLQPIGMLAQQRGAFVQHPARDAHHCHQGQGAHQQRGHGKAQAVDQVDPGRRKKHPAQARAVIGHGQGGGALAHKPGSNDCVDRRRAQGHPAQAAEQCTDKQLIGLAGQGPTEQAQGQEQGAEAGDARQPETPVQPGQVGDHQGSCQKMHGDGRRAQAQGPTAALDHRVHENRRSIKADAPAERGQDKGCEHHFIAEEYCSIHCAVPWMVWTPQSAGWQGLTLRCPAKYQCARLG